MDKPIESIANRLKKAMSLRDCKQIELSYRTKIPKGSISQYVTGYVEPKTDRIYAIAKALNVNPVWLMGFDVPMEPQGVEKLNEDTADLFLAIKDDSQLMKIVAYYLTLSEIEQSSIYNIVKSMASQNSEGVYEVIGPAKKGLFHKTGYQVRPCARPSQERKDNPGCN